MWGLWSRIAVHSTHLCPIDFLGELCIVSSESKGSKNTKRLASVTTSTIFSGKRSNSQTKNQYSRKTLAKRSREHHKRCRFHLRAIKN